MKQSVKVLLYHMIILWSVPALSLDLTRINLSYQYDLGFNLKLEYRITEKEGNLTVIYKVPQDTMGLWVFSILAQNSYDSPVHDTLSYENLDTLSFDASGGIYQFQVPDNPPSLLVFAFTNLSLGVSRAFDVRLQAPGGFPSFYPVNEDNLPIFKNYVIGNSIAFRTSGNELHAYRYFENFDPADPPMGEMGPLAPTLDIDSSIFFETQLDDLLDYHFYLFQTDTFSNNAVTLLKCPQYYPELKQFEELIKPMRYITTSQEYQALLQSTNPRKAFESFWLNTYGTQFRAKGAIRYFFRQIEEANQLFTDYKQGWKTDRGILYIIYGLPDVVTRTDRLEIWKYDSGEEFEFIRLPTLFTPSLYSLKRSTEYERSWYQKVGEIRKGQ